MDWRDYTEANRQAWNEVTPLHQQAKAGRFFEAFKQPGYSCLDAIITERLKRVGVAGKTVAQICCNDGRELLSLKNLGASRCVGFDISDDAIAQARLLAESSGIACEFVRTDALDIPRDYDAQFDLIYISIGVFGWMPDLARFFAVVARLLKPGATLVVYEQHPFCEVLPMDPKLDPLKLTSSYFKDSPEAECGGLEYWGGTKYDGKINYWFGNTLSTIFNALIENQLEVRSLEEFPHDISAGFAHVERAGLKLPLSYVMVGKKL